MTSAARESEIQRIQSVYAARSGERDRYGLFNNGQMILSQERERDILRLLRRQIPSLERQSILEVGCNSGIGLLDWIRWGANPSHMRGIDILEDRLDEARHRLPKSVALALESGDALSSADASFDIVVQSTVFSSILDRPLQEAIAREMLRVLKPQGFILWYDFFVNNPWNAQVRGISRSDIRALFPGTRIRFYRSTTLSPLVRALAPVSETLCLALSTLPFLKTHWLALITKENS